MGQQQLDARSDRAQGSGPLSTGLPTAGGADGAEMPKPRELNVQTRLIFHERIVPVGPAGLLRPSGERKREAGLQAVR